jgi:NitT/TauT family transport system substrate-binding protein
MRSTRYHRLALLVTAALAVSAVCACSSGSSSTSSSGSGSGPELTNVSVAALEIPDAVSLRIAQQDGFFKQQGLNVTIQTLSVPDPTAALAAHTLDFSSYDYVGLFEQELHNPQLHLKEIVDDGQGEAGDTEILVPKNSPIKSPADLKGKKIAMAGLGVNIGSVPLNELLGEYHVPANDYTVVPMPFPNMPQALKSGEVDAADVVEPFVTISEAQGARTLADVFTGSLSGFPISCWVTTGSFAQQYPKTVAAFQRALVNAQQVAASDPALVRKMLPSFITGLTPQLANVMALEDFNSTVSASRLDRVANLLDEFKLLPSSFNVNSLIYTPSGS